MRTLFTFLSLFTLSAQAGGLRGEAVTMPGAFIRAGGPGGQTDLSKDILMDLCQKGVRTVYYLYPTVKFKNKGTYSCVAGGQPHTLEYKGGDFRGPGAKAILQDIARSASEGSGPVLAHCWNGWHATGEIAAYALIQLCGLSGEQGAQYWARTIGDKQNVGKYSSIMSRIRKFKPYADIRLSEQEKARVCP